MTELDDIVSWEINRMVCFVTPGAVMAVPLPPGPPLVCRRQFEAAAIILDAEDGLIREMEEVRRPVPWYSEAERKAALDQIRADRWIDGPTRGRLMDHVGRTPFYRW